MGEGTLSRFYVPTVDEIYLRQLSVTLSSPEVTQYLSDGHFYRNFKQVATVQRTGEDLLNHSVLILRGPDFWNEIP